MRKKPDRARARRQRRSRGQVVLEFTFCFIIVLLLLYGVIMALRWAGVSLAERRKAHDDTLTADIAEQGWNWSTIYEDGPFKQLNPNFAPITPMHMVFNGW